MIVDKFRDYFSAFNGTATWEDLEPLFENLFHNDLTVKVASGEIDRNGWVLAVKKLLADGAVAKVNSIRLDGDQLIYSGEIKTADGSVMRPFSKGTVKDDKLIRVRPLNPIEYTSIAGTVTKV